MGHVTKTSAIACIVLALAAILIAVGVAQGDPLWVFRKAALICYECIGIG